MSNETCQHCRTIWNASERPECPHCLPIRWMQADDFLRDKHAPASLSSPNDRDRSIMSQEYLDDPIVFLQHLASDGTPYYNRQHKKYNYIGATPGSAVARSAVPANGTVTTHPYYGLQIADAAGSAHIFAEDPGKIHYMYSVGSLQPIPRCVVGSCNNLAIPSKSQCVVHTWPPLAD